MPQQLRRTKVVVQPHTEAVRGDGERSDADADAPPLAREETLEPRDGRSAGAQRAAVAAASHEASKMPPDTQRERRRDRQRGEPNIVGERRVHLHADVGEHDDVCCRLALAARCEIRQMQRKEHQRRNRSDIVQTMPLRLAESPRWLRCTPHSVTVDVRRWLRTRLAQVVHERGHECEEANNAFEVQC